MAIEIFLKIDGLDGEAVEEGHESEIKVKSWSWDMTQTSTPQTGQGGKANVKDVRIEKYVDKASPNLMRQCCAGKTFETAKLTCREAGGDSHVEYLVVEMENVVISKVKVQGAEEADRITESIKLSIGKYKVTYTPVDEARAAQAAVGPVGWDMQKNKAI